jgi:hypothetical protein
VSWDKDAAIEAARAQASADPNSIVSVIQTKTGFAVISKPRNKLTVHKPLPGNVAAQDDPGYASGAPGETVAELYRHAYERMAALFATPEGADDE